MRRSFLLILFLIAPIALGTVATWGSQVYKAAVITKTGFNYPGCLWVVRTTWYGFPIPWSFTTHTLVFRGCELLDVLSSPDQDYHDVAEGAFLLDILIYIVLYYALYYASIQLYLWIRRAVFIRTRLSSNTVRVSRFSVVTS